MRYPSLTNVVYYAKHFFFKSAFGRLFLLFLFITVFNVFIFSQFYWPKILRWLQNSTSTSDNISLSENEF
jgi:hypothetical protein